MKKIFTHPITTVILLIIITILIIDRNVSFKSSEEYRFLTEEDYFNSVNTTLEVSNKFMNAITVFDRDTLTADQDSIIREIHSEISPYLDTLEDKINQQIYDVEVYVIDL